MLPVQLSASSSSSCFLEPSSQGGYLSCDVRSTRKPTTSIPLDIVRGSRPSVCENPSVADSSPMADCSYRFHDLSRCGCPTLDPNKHPEVWEAYVEAVKGAIKERLHQEVITVTLFASGYLLQDCELLDNLLNDEEMVVWKGRLNLQFVDLNYEIKNAVVKHADSSDVDWEKLLPALVLGICGGGSLIYGATKKNRVAVVAGVILVIAALVLGFAANKEEAATKVDFKIDQPIMQTIDQFLGVIENRTPFELHTDFFPNAEACCEKKEMSDLVLGYDIDDTFAIFDNLRMKTLKQAGRVILVTKDGSSNETAIPVLRQAWGPKGDYYKTFFN